MTKSDYVKLAMDMNERSFKAISRGYYDATTYAALHKAIDGVMKAHRIYPMRNCTYIKKEEAKAWKKPIKAILRAMKKSHRHDAVWGWNGIIERHVWETLQKQHRFTKRPRNMYDIIREAMEEIEK